MVGTGFLMLAVSWLSVWQMRKRREPSPLLARVLVGMTFSGWVAVLTGWYTTEIGRQPYLVTGVMRTAEALGPTSAGTVMATLVAWLVLYGILISAYIAVIFGLAANASKQEGMETGINALGPKVGPFIDPKLEPGRA
jgi:cytochrome d ubiquinol oxidase subunit I